LSARPYGENGYALIGVDFHRYDPAVARQLIDKHLALVWSDPPSPDPARWQYVGLDWLARRLDRMPADTRKLLVFVPTHHLYPRPGSAGADMIAECKRRVVQIAQQRPNADVIDFAIPSPVTTEEDRWWDAVHARPETMARVSRALGRAVADGEGLDARVLTPHRGTSESLSSR
jgi:hypothetical protein